MGSSSALIYRSWAWIKQMSPIVPIDSLNIRREDETGDVMSTIKTTRQTGSFLQGYKP